MLARSCILYLIAAVLFASLAGSLASKVANADAATHPTSGGTPSFTPLMVLRPIGHRLKAKADPKDAPLIVEVSQAGKEFSKVKRSLSHPYGKPYGKIENGATYIGSYDSKSHKTEGAEIDGSIEVRLLPAAISMPLPTGENDDIYLLKRGADAACWFYRNALPKSPIKLHDTRGVVVVWIDTHYQINGGDCKH